MKQKVVAYLRVSSDLQTEGHGFDRQIEQISAYATAHHLNVLRTYEESFTGTEQSRPELNRLIQERLSDTILIESMDRFSRSTLNGLTHLMDLVLEGFDIVDCSTGESLAESLNGHPIQKFLLNVKFAVSQYERDLVAYRLHQGRKEASRKAGRYVAVRKTGIYPQDVRDRIRKMHRRRKNWAAVARELNQSDIKPARADHWSGDMARSVAIGG